MWKPTWCRSRATNNEKLTTNFVGWAEGRWQNLGTGRKTNFLNKINAVGRTLPPETPKLDTKVTREIRAVTDERGWKV